MAYLLLSAWLFFAYTTPVFAAATAVVHGSAQISICGNGVKEGGEECDGSDFNGNTCLALGFEKGGFFSCTASCELETTGCQTDADAVLKQPVTHTTGGTHNQAVGDDSVTVSLPPNFHSKEAKIFMLAYNPAEPWDHTGLMANGRECIGEMYGLTLLDADGRIVHSLSAPATVMMTYNDDDLEPGVDPETLMPFYQEPGDTVWHAIDGAVVDTVLHQITFTTTHFSTFGIAGVVRAETGVSHVATNFTGMSWPTRISIRPPLWQPVSDPFMLASTPRIAAKSSPPVTTWKRTATVGTTMRAAQQAASGNVALPFPCEAGVAADVISRLIRFMWSVLRLF